MIYTITALLIALYQYRRAVFYKKRYVQTKKDLNQLLKRLFSHERKNQSIDDPQ